VILKIEFLYIYIYNLELFHISQVYRLLECRVSLLPLKVRRRFKAVERFSVSALHPDIGPEIWVTRR